MKESNQMAVDVLCGKRFDGVAYGTAPGTGFIVGYTPLDREPLLLVDQIEKPGSIYCVKYYHHETHDSRDDRPAESMIALTMLVSQGRWRQKVWSETTPDFIEVLLKEPGDFIVWGPHLKHSWHAVQKSTMLTVKWTPLGKLIVVVGLPGSGKSHYIKSPKTHSTSVVAEDYMADSHNHGSCFTDSRHYDQLIHDLRHGKDCIIADIEFCAKSKQEEVEKEVRKCVPGVTIEWHCFENNPQQCAANVEQRSRNNAGEEKEKIHRLSRIYHIPNGAKVLPVWPPGGTHPDQQSKHGEQPNE
jgi:hypothetical protein